MPRTKSKSKVYRSAKTGRFVTERFAMKNPDTTVGESTRKKRRKS